MRMACYLKSVQSLTQKSLISIVGVIIQLGMQNGN